MSWPSLSNRDEAVQLPLGLQSLPLSTGNTGGRLSATVLVTDKRKMNTIEKLLAVLVQLENDIYDNAEGAVIWVGPSETACERIYEILEESGGDVSQLRISNDSAIKLRK